MNAQLQAIAKDSSEVFVRLVEEAEAEILKAIEDVTKASGEDDTEAKFRLGFTVTYNLDKSRLSHRLSFSVLHKREAETAVPDPNQTSLPIE